MKQRKPLTPSVLLLLGAAFAVSIVIVLYYCVFIPWQVRYSYRSVGRRVFGPLYSGKVLDRHMPMVRELYKEDIEFSKIHSWPPREENRLYLLAESGTEEDEEVLWLRAVTGYPQAPHPYLYSSGPSKRTLSAQFVRILSYMLIERYGVEAAADKFFKRIRSPDIAPEIRGVFLSAPPELLNTNIPLVRQWTEAYMSEDRTVDRMSYNESYGLSFLANCATEADEKLFWKRAKMGYRIGETVAEGYNRKWLPRTQASKSDSFARILRRLLKDRHGAEEAASILAERMQGDDVAPEIKKAYEELLDYDRRMEKWRQERLKKQAKEE